ncbi:MAG: hypothetical protein JWN44_3586 [Myxococcales bacterium]|nr:hypothetical protein [Myxococcales bacterium]
MLLLGLIYGRPQELVEILRPLPLFYAFVALALLGWLTDLRLRKTRPAFAPADGAVAAFVVWVLATVAMRRPDDLAKQTVELLIPLVGYFLLAHAIQSFRAFQLVAATVLVLTLYLAAVAVHQGLAPRGCHVVDPRSEDAAASYDGRRCDVVEECAGGDDPTAEYACEKAGLFGTSSVAGGRVRYRGALADPEALALVVALGLPFAFALFTRRPGFLRGLVVVASLCLVGGCVLYTGSRGGQVAYLAVLATYLVRRFGWKGLVAAGLLALPVVLVARGDAEVAARASRGSYALVAAELGFPGLVAWGSVLYLSAKIPIVAIRRYGNDSSTKLARTWALSLLAALAGLGVGLFFVPFAYHQLFWIVMGLCAAFYAACRAHDPGFEVRYGWRDLVAVVAGATALVLYQGWQPR